MKIRIKLVLNLFFVALVSAATVFSIVYLVGKNIMINTIADYNFLLVENRINAIDRNIYQRLEEWQSYVVSHPDVLKEIELSNSEFANRPDREDFIRRQDENWKKAADEDITPFMRGILENTLSKSMREGAEFYAKKYNYDLFPEFFLTNKYGMLVASTHKTTDYLQSDEEWWQKAEEHGIWVSDVIFDESSETRALEICVRVDDSFGNFVGVAKIVYNVEEIFRMVDDIVKPLGELGDGSISGITRKTFVASLINKYGQLIYSTTDTPKNPTIISQFLNAKDNKSSEVIIDRGVEKFYSHVHSTGYNGFKGLGWFLVIEKETDEVLTPLHALINWLWLSVFLTVFVAVFISLTTARSLSKPLMNLTKEIKDVESGNLDIEMTVASKDEIGQLAEAFNRMVKSVKNSRKEIERKVEEQTKEIKQKAEELVNKQMVLLNVLDDVEREKNKLALANARDEAILSGIGDGVFVLDTERRIILFNPIAEKISGFSVKEAIGRKYSEILKFVLEKNGKVNDEFIGEAMVKGKIAQMVNHTVLIRKDGTQVPVADSAAPIKDVNGKIFGCVVVFRDVTKERDIDKSKTEFVSVASHQLRTPLTGIKWFSELLLKSKISATTKDYVQQIAFSNERMVRLVDDLLNVSRIETGKKFDIILKNTDIVPIVKSVLKEQSPNAEQKNIALACSKDSPHELIMPIDELKIRQVFQNLISNAIKYSKEKKEITVGCEQKNGEVIFFVKDSGIGIPQHQQNQIFNKFFRAENVFTMHTDGTGLGLYIVKAIVEAHHGKVWFESVENKGTTFFVSLPTKLIK